MWVLGEGMAILVMIPYYSNFSNSSSKIKISESFLTRYLNHKFKVIAIGLKKLFFDSVGGFLIVRILTINLINYLPADSMLLYPRGYTCNL